MQTIDTAPKDGTIINLFNAKHGFEAMAWNKRSKKWEGKRFMPMGIVKVVWCKDHPDQPTHWKPIN